MTATIKVTAAVREQDLVLVLPALKADLQTAQQVHETMALQGTAYDTKASALIPMLNTLVNNGLAFRNQVEKGTYSYALTAEGEIRQKMLAVVVNAPGESDNDGSDTQADVPAAESETGGVAMPGKVELEQAIMNTLVFAEEPMTKAGILRSSGIKQAGGQLTQAFAHLVEIGAIVPVADGYRASDEAKEAAGIETAALTYGAKGSKGKGSKVVEQAEAVVGAKVAKSTLTEERAAELQELAERIAAFDPMEGVAPVELKGEVESLNPEERKAARAFTQMVPGTDSATNGARFRVLGLLTGDEVREAQEDGRKRREKKVVEKAERKPKAATGPNMSVIQFTSAYKAQDTSICSIAAMAVYNGVKGAKALGRDAIVKALVEARPADGEKYAKEGLALLVKRNVLVAAKDKEDKIVGYTMPEDVRTMIKNQLAARVKAKQAAAATDAAIEEAEEAEAVAQ